MAILATIGAFITCIPMSYIKIPFYRKIYSFTFGMVFGFYFMGAKMIINIMQLMSGYFILKLFPIRYAVWIAPVFAAICLLIR